MPKTSNPRPSLAVALLGWIGGTVISIVVLGMGIWYEWTGLGLCAAYQQRLSWDEVSAEVTAVAGNLVEYRFRWRDAEYKARQNAEVWEPRAGQKLSIRVDPRHPAESLLYVFCPLQVVRYIRRAAVSGRRLDAS